MYGVIFDLGGTLKRDFSIEDSKNFMRNTFKKYKINEGYLDVFSDLLAQKMFDFTSNKNIVITAEQIFFEIFQDQLLAKNLSDDLSLSHSKFNIEDKVIHVLQKLKEDNYKLFLLSNTIWNSDLYLDEHQKFFSIFDSVFFSDKTRYRKTYKEAFENILDSEKVPASEFVMVGDSYENDIKPAQSLGMKALLFTNNSIFLPENSIEKIYEAIIKDENNESLY